jgi:hypothetical protein
MLGTTEFLKMRFSLTRSTTFCSLNHAKLTVSEEKLTTVIAKGSTRMSYSNLLFVQDLKPTDQQSARTMVAWSDLIGSCSLKVLLKQFLAMKLQS